MEKNKRNKIIGLSIGILIVLIIVVSSTYAYWQITKTQKNPNDIVAACLDITMENETGTFGLDKAWPISDSEGEALTGYTFEVKNNCDENVNYIVGLNSVEGNSDNYLDYSSLRLKLDDKQSSLISELGNIGYSDPENKETVRDSKLLSMESLEGKGTATHNVKVWIDEDAPVTEQGKIFRGQIFITGGQGVPIYDECFAIDTEGIILNYDYSCGYNVEVPATIAGIEVKTINQASFTQKDLMVYNVIDKTTSQEKTISYVMNMDMYDPLIEWAKSQYCEDPTNCDFFALAEAAGLIVISSQAEFDALDWDNYEITYSAAQSLNLETGEITNATNPIKSLDLSKAVNLENIEANSFYSGSEERRGNLENLILPEEGNVNIKEYAFAFQNLKKLVIPQSVITISDYSFYDNVLTEIQLNRGLKTIGNYAFGSELYYSSEYNNEISGELIIPASVEQIGMYAFGKSYSSDNGNQISQLIFEDTLENPSQLKTIGYKAFSGNQISNISLPSSLEIIGRGAFSENDIEGEVIIPASVKTLGSSAFGSNQITSLRFEDTEENPSKLITIEDLVFMENDIEGEVIIPGSVESIGSQAFDYNYITSVRIPASVKTIGSSAFKGQKSINNRQNQIISLTFEDTLENPSKLVSIASNAFAYNKITNLIIPSSVTKIESGAFFSNPNLTEVIIKNIEGNVTIEYGALPAATIIYNPNYTE